MTSDKWADGAGGLTLNKRRMVLVVAALALAGVGCDRGARGLLSVAAPQGLAEGRRAQVTITISNVHREPIIPLALTLYVRPDPTEYLVERRTVGEVEYYKPLQATEVRHLQTLNRIEADHLRDGNVWRHVPDSRFLHPRILLPGQTVTETFGLQAIAAHRRLLCCDFSYITLSSDRARGRLFVRTKPDAVPPDAERYTEVFTRIGEGEFNDTSPQPERYLLYRPARIYDKPPVLVSREVRLDVRAQGFTYQQAARRARHGARTYVYFSAAGAWAFEYADDGTWFVGPDAVTKLNGHYAALVTDVETRQATVITLTAARKPDDKLLQHLEKAGYSDPTAKGPNAVATIPTESLLAVLEQAEALGYTIQATTWKPMP